MNILKISAIFIGIVLTISIFFIFLDEKPHKCYDSTHQICDGECVCDGYQCSVLEKLPASGMNLVHKAPRYSDYELNIISEDSIAVFDGQRYVGTIFFTDDSEIGALLQKDNE